MIWSYLFACCAGLNAALYYDDPNPWSIGGAVTSVMLFVANLWED